MVLYEPHTFNIAFHFLSFAHSHGVSFVNGNGATQHHTVLTRIPSGWAQAVKWVQHQVGANPGVAGHAYQVHQESTYFVISVRKCPYSSLASRKEQTNRALPYT